MATKNFRSTVLEPTSEFAHGDKLRFTALATVGEVLKGSFSETTIGEDGVYSVDLQYGKHRIDYKPYEGVWRHFADVEVNADTLATTLQDLALASVPVTDETILVLQGILADAEAAKTESAAIRDEAAASAAAAAEDAAKLADVTPESIGAVSNISGSPIAFKPSSSASKTGNANYYIRIDIPDQITYSRLNLAIDIFTHGGMGDCTLYVTGMFAKNNAVGGAATRRAGGLLNIDVLFCLTSDGLHYLLLRQSDTTWDNPIIYIHSASATYNQVGSQFVSSGWGLSILDPSYTPSPSEIKKTITATGLQPTFDASVVVSMSYDNKNYTMISRDDDHGIPLADFDAALAEQQASELFKNEKSIALQIMADFNLGTGEHEITGSDIADVRAYIQSIDPAKGLKAGHLQRAKIPRPSIFDRYS